MDDRPMNRPFSNFSPFFVSPPEGLRSLSQARKDSVRGEGWSGDVRQHKALQSRRGPDTI